MGEAVEDCVADAVLEADEEEDDVGVSLAVVNGAQTMQAAGSCACCTGEQAEEHTKASTVAADGDSPIE